MEADITLTIREESTPVTFAVQQEQTVTLQCIEGGAVSYIGEYDVTPKFEQTILETKDKTMTDDVTVRAIPVSRTSNPSGGKTIYIGEI